MRTVAVLVACAAVACGRIGFDDSGDDGIGSPGGVTAVSVTVAPRYEYQPDWTEYLVADGSDAFSASDSSSCLAGAAPYTACIHGGEIRVATVAGLTDCTGLALTDALGAFTWTCRTIDPNEDGSVYFYSLLAPGKGLRDLVTDAGWLANSVTLTGDGESTSSGSAVWWTNPVMPLPDNSTPGAGALSLAGSGTIYVLSADRTTDGYTIDAPHVSLVTLAGARLTRNSGAANPAVITATGADDAWLELDLDAADANDGIRVTSSAFVQVFDTSVRGGGNGSPSGSSLVLDGTTSSQVRHLRAADSAGCGLLVGDTATSDGNYFEDLGIASAADKGVYLHFGTQDLFDGVIVADGGSHGLVLGPFCDAGSATDNTAVGVRAFGNAGDGVFVNAETEHVIDALAVGNGGAGFVFTNACGYPWGSTLVDAVSAFNGDIGVLLDDHNMTFENVVSIGNGTWGFSIGGQAEWSQIAASDSGQFDVVVSGDTTFDANLIVSGGSACQTQNSATGIGSACMPDGSSTATLAYRGSLLGDFIGAVTADAANASATAGDATYPSSAGFDWVTFADRHRVWGRWNTSGQWTSGTGEILDFRLLASASNLLDNTGTVTAANDPFVAGGPCPAAASGTAAVENHDDAGGWGNLPNQTYLVAAVEITSPGAPGYAAAIGNHDGLCESGEHCMYAPNFGAYQGEGAIGTCVFADGAVTGVTMYGYAHDGAP